MGRGVDDGGRFSRYLIEATVCRNGNLVFIAVQTDDTSATSPMSRAARAYPKEALYRRKARLTPIL